MQIWPQIISGGLIGTFIGAIPGAGGDIAVFVSYGFNKSFSKYPEKWGTGIPQGVASTESANNGCSGGAMIPLLSLGVPGDAVTAIILGAFIMKGIQPGPTMYRDQLDTVYCVFAALMLANLAMLIVGHGRRFAGGTASNKGIHATLQLIINDLGKVCIIHQSIFIKGGDQGGGNARKNGFLFHIFLQAETAFCFPKKIQPRKAPRLRPCIKTSG
jgi:hypothetical protein